MDSSDTKSSLFFRIENGIKKWLLWENIIGPSLKNRIKRLYYFNFKYILLIFSHVTQFRFRVRSIFGNFVVGRMPEHFYWIFFGILPGYSEIALTRFLLKDLKKGDVFIDIGANCGFYSLLAGSIVEKNGMVHGFEPVPNIFSMLVYNTKNLPNVSINQVAISNKIGISQFLFCRSCSPISSFFENSNMSGKEVERINVKTETLDHYLNQYGIIPTFIKIDVEGAENFVLEGAMQCLNKYSPVVVLEIWASNNKAHKSAFDLLINLGYSPYQIGSDGVLIKVDAIFTGVVKLIHGETENFVFKKVNL